MGDSANKIYTAPDGSVYRIESDGSVTKIKDGNQSSNFITPKYHVTPDGKIYQIFPDGKWSFLGFVENEAQPSSRSYHSYFAVQENHSPSSNRLRMSNPASSSYTPLQSYLSRSSNSGLHSEKANYSQPKKKNGYILKFLFFVVIGLIASVAVYHIIKENHSEEIQSRLKTTAVGSMAAINNSPSVTQDGLNIHFYEGQIYPPKSKPVENIMLAFVENEHGLVKAIYKHMRLEDKIKLRITYVDDQKITLLGEDGNNDLVIDLDSNPEPDRPDLLKGKMKDGSKSFNVRLMPSNKTFKISSDALY